MDREIKRLRACVRIGLFLVGLGLAGLVPSCQLMTKPGVGGAAGGAAGGAGFLVASLQDRIFPDSVIGVENPLMVDPSDLGIHLYSAGGETVCFQMILPPANPDEAALVIGSFELIRSDGASENIRSIGPERWRAYQLLGVPVKEFDAVSARLDRPETLSPREFPDPLLEVTPVGAGRFTVPRLEGRNRVLVLEFAVPPKIPAGEFAGKLTIKSGWRETSRAVTLHTWGFDLPDPGVKMFGRVQAPVVWTEHGLGDLRDRDVLVLPADVERVRRFADRIGQYARVLDDHGVEPWLTEMYPRIAGTGPGALSADWASYRLVAEAVWKSASHGRSFWPAPVDLAYPPSRNFGPYSSASYRQMLGTYLAQFNRQILGPGLAGKGLAALTWEDRYRPGLDLYDATVRLAKEIAATKQPLLVIDPFIPIDLKPLGWYDFKPFDRMEKYSRVYCPSEKWLDPSFVAQAKEKGRTVWWRPTESGQGIPAVRIAYPTYFGQALAWTAWRYETGGAVLDGLTRTQGTNESGSADVPDADESGRFLVYPGRYFGQDKPLGSMRLKMIRAGLQDAAYLRALDRTGKKDLADWLGRRLVRFAHTDSYDGSLWTVRNDGWCREEQAWALARVIAGYEMIAHRPVPATQQAAADLRAIKHKTLLGQFRDLTEGTVLEIDGVRAKNVLDVNTGTEKIEWTFHTVARNFTESAEQGTVSFAELPSSVAAPRDRMAVSGLNWAWPVRTELKLETPSATLGLFGINVQPIALRLKNGREVRTQARYCALAAQKLETPIELDGEFGDWPDSPAATAGNFLRIRPDGLNENRLAGSDRNPTWSTTVRMGCTGRNFYLAFTCYQPRETLVVNPTNTVTASGGFAWGEDLAEVIVDPNNSGSFNPFDVYHVIVKANGTVIGLRGTVDAGLMGATPAWPNGVRAAVRVFDDRWQAEVDIPMADLGAEGKLNRWWGVDFARVTSSAAEWSTWSGTKNQYCKPVSLGNVFIAK